MNSDFNIGKKVKYSKSFMLDWPTTKKGMGKLRGKIVGASDKVYPFGVIVQWSDGRVETENTRDIERA